MSDADGSGFGKFIPGFDFMQNLARQTSGGLVQGVQQAVPQGRVLAFDQLGQERPDRVAGWRAAGEEVVDLHHLVHRMHLVER